MKQIAKKSGQGMGEQENDKKRGNHKIKVVRKVRYKDDLQLATWNCRGIQRKTPSEHIINIMKDNRINILALTETHMNTNCI